jgi:hypothetical protein
MSRRKSFFFQGDYLKYFLKSTFFSTGHVAPQNSLCRRMLGSNPGLF